MAISPQTQSMMQVPTPHDAEEAFEQGFGDNAIRVFTSKFPDMAHLMTVFKIVNSDPDKGNAVGAFLLGTPNETVIIPVIMASNTIKPFEVMYHQETDTYVPLDRRWLNEVLKKNTNDLGGPVKAPKTLNRDVDIRNLIVPPYVGRYAYAAAGSTLGKGVALSYVLKEAPNHVKRAFSTMLKKNRPVLKYAFQEFDEAMLLDALKPHAEKTAAAPEVEWLSNTDSPERYREVFGTDAGMAFQVATKLGYVAQDLRTKTALLVESGPLRFSEINESGFYRFQRVDGGEDVQALVICNPVSLDNSGSADLTLGQSKAPNHYSQHHVMHNVDKTTLDTPHAAENQARNQGFTVYTEDGDLFTLDGQRWAPVAMPLHREDVRGKLRDLLDGKGDAVTPNSSGIFVQVRGNGITGTATVDAKSVTTDSKGIRRIKGQFDYFPVTMVTSPDSTISKIVARKDEQLMYLPRDMVFLARKSSGSYEDDPKHKFVTSATANIMLHEGLKKTGAVELGLRRNDMGDFVMKRARWEGNQQLGQRLRVSEREAVQTFVDAGIKFGDAVNAVKTAAHRGEATFYALHDEQIEKLAQMPGVDPSMMAPAPDPSAGGPPAGGPPPGAPMDPNAGAPVDPAAAGAPVDPNTGMPVDAMAPPGPPMPPPLPSPVDLAVADVSAAYAQQAADTAQQLANQQQALADRLAVLQEVKMRADEISASHQVGQEPPPVAVTPAEELVPPVEPAPGMDEMGGMGDEMSMPPEEEVPLEDGLPVEMGSTMEDAANVSEEIEDPSLFEATALANLAANPDLKELSADYIPAMEDTVDHLARMLLTLWLKEGEYTEVIGNEDYSALEEKMRSVFNNLGDLILQISQGVPKSNATGTEP